MEKNTEREVRFIPRGELHHPKHGKIVRQDIDLERFWRCTHGVPQVTKVGNKLRPLF